MDNHQPSSGFPPDVLQQLNQASQQVAHSHRGRGRGRSQGRGQAQPQSRQYQHAVATTQSYSGPPLSIDSFPPLGARQAPSHTTVSNSAFPAQQPNATSQDYQRHGQSRDFFDRSRGSHQGYQARAAQNQNPSNYTTYHPRANANNDFRRPPAPHGNLYQSNSQPGASNWSTPDQQRSYRQQVMAQADYLNRVQRQALDKYQLKRDEQEAKEAFRKRLENVFQDALSKQYPDFSPNGARLKCYGSLNNGFGLAGCDMDLLLALPEDFFPATAVITDPLLKVPSRDARKPGNQTEDASAPEDTAEAREQENFDVGWLLEGKLLDAGLGARLLTKTRVPILKICESPSEDLLRNLRQYRLDQAKAKTPPDATPSVSASTMPPSLDMKALKAALGDLEDLESASQVSLPGDPAPKTGASLEFDGDYGIKCDVNFSNSVAVHNTALLRQYCLFDPRVSEVGVFVKTWAKTRDINTPYYGTLSSYGYVMMVLHFMMNIVSPPVIPNLQNLAQDEDAWAEKDVELFEGKYDIRFWSDRRKIEEHRRNMTPNLHTTGNLIRGFFWYYSARDGFNWKTDIISLRTKGGILKKHHKGWTEAKWSEKSDKKNVRLRYLMAIEDPFETDHNVARVVGHNGIVAIRDEFRRAWDIIGRIGSVQAHTDDLMEALEGRGDLLRKDQDHQKEKMKQLRLAAEAKERDLREASARDNVQVQQNGTSSDNESSSPLPLRTVSGNGRSSNSKLTHRAGTFQDKPRQYSRRIRKVMEESDGEDDDVHDISVRKNEEMLNESCEVRTDDVDSDPEPFCSPEDVSLARGFDAWGEPVAWNLSTQDGRWLEWRDNKVRLGTWQAPTNPDQTALDKACPYDARRPRGQDISLGTHPPFPLNKYAGETSRTPSDRVHKFSHGARRASIRKASASQSHIPTAVVHSAPEQQLAMFPLRWCHFTAGGRWLRRRDALIRSGKLNVAALDDWERRLHFGFPYNPQMLYSELGESNRKLRQSWRWRSLAQNGQESPAPLPEEKSSVEYPAQVIDATCTVLPDLDSVPLDVSMSQQSRSQLIICPHVTLEPSLQSQAKATQSESNEQPTEYPEEAMPSAAFLRSRRLAYFAQASESAISKASNGDERDDRNVQTLMEEAGIDTKRPKLTKKDSAIGIWASSDTRSEFRVRDAQPVTQPSAQPAAISEAQTCSQPDMDSEVGPKVAKDEDEAADKVPSTLYPSVSSDERPKDEDPQIMPIPRTYGFKFDVRQLRDLAVIKEGGNGCARAGQEFEIEEEYEWGGGGEMGHKSTSGIRESSGVDRDVYEYGMGDQQGLMAELPGLDD